MLLEGDNARVTGDWQVSESSPIGFCRVYWIHSGIVTYTDGGGSRRLASGNIYVFPSAAPYHMTTDPNDPLDCTFVHIDVKPVMVQRLVCLLPEGTVGTVFQALQAAFREGTPGAAPHLADAFTACCLKNGTFAHPSPFLGRVHAYMAEHLSAPLALCELSAHFGYNGQYFIRRFKAAAGVPPYQYLLHLRLQEAARLLRACPPGGRQSMGEIAQAVGFRDDTSFSRAFARQFGLPPGKFRRLTTPVP